MTRREWIGAGSVVAIAAIIAGRFALSGPSSGAAQESFPFELSEAQWRDRLSPEAYTVLREGGTETPYTSDLLAEKRVGTFACAGCDQPLFDSQAKYDSRTGWPSFWDVIPDAVVERDDYTLGMSRIELLCDNCGGHLGHVFGDGPEPTGLRYCINGAALAFQPKEDGKREEEQAA